MSKPVPNSDDPPFGIESRHDQVGRFAPWRTPLAILLIGGIIAAAFTGWLGGGPDDTKRIETAKAAVEMRYAAVLRSGNWFETEVRITPRVPVKDLVVEIDDSLWRAMSIDTLVPDAESATSLDGSYAYHFGEVKAGEFFTLKFDGQIQPRAFRSLKGNMRIADGESDLAVVPLSLTVLP